MLASGAHLGLAQMRRWSQEKDAADVALQEEQIKCVSSRLIPQAKTS